MRRSTQSSSSRVLIAGTTLVLICGAMLCIPRTSSVPLTASIEPISSNEKSRSTVPSPPSAHGDDQQPYGDQPPSQIEVPQFLKERVARQNQPIQHVTMSHPAQAFDDGFENDTDSHIFDDGPYEEPAAERDEPSAFGADFFEDEIIDEPVPSPSAERLAAQPPSKSDFDFDDTGFGDLQPAHPIESPATPAEPTVAATVIREEIDTTDIEAELKEIRAEIARTADTRFREAKIEHQAQINRLQEEIEQLRREQAQQRVAAAQPDTKQPTTAEKQPLRLPTTPQPEIPSPFSPPGPSETVRSTKRKTKTNVAQKPNDFDPLALPPTMLPPTVVEPRSLPRTVEIPEGRRQIEYPPIDMTPPRRQQKASQQTQPNASSAPTYLYMPPNNPASMRNGKPSNMRMQSSPQSASQLRTATVPKCTRSSPRHSLLSRLRSSRPEPCKHCGQVH